MEEIVYDRRGWRAVVAAVEGCQRLLPCRVEAAAEEVDTDWCCGQRWGGTGESGLWMAKRAYRALQGFLLLANWAALMEATATLDRWFVQFISSWAEASIRLISWSGLIPQPPARKCGFLGAGTGGAMGSATWLFLVGGWPPDSRATSATLELWTEYKNKTLMKNFSCLVNIRQERIQLEFYTICFCPISKIAIKMAKIYIIYKKRNGDCWNKNLHKKCIAKGSNLG